LKLIDKVNMIQSNIKVFYNFILTYRRQMFGS